jgi:hypothetical protein
VLQIPTEYFPGLPLEFLKGYSRIMMQWSKLFLPSHSDTDALIPLSPVNEFEVWNY